MDYQPQRMHNQPNDAWGPLGHRERSFFNWLTSATVALLVMFFAYVYVINDPGTSDEHYPLLPASILCPKASECTISKHESIHPKPDESLSKSKDLEPVEFDYALQSLGAKILSTRSTTPFSTQYVRLFNVPVWSDIYDDSQTNAPLIPGRIIPGQCWRFKNFPGRLVIQLADSVVVTSFSLSHTLSASVPQHAKRSATKNFQVWGLREVHDPTPHWFGNYTLLLNGPNYQDFPVKNVVSVSFPIVELVVLSNYGATYTCVYRFKVFGTHHEDILEALEIANEGF